MIDFITAAAFMALLGFGFGALIGWGNAQGAWLIECKKRGLIKQADEGAPWRWVSDGEKIP